MSTRTQTPSLELGFTRLEKYRFDRLKGRLVEQLEAHGCRTIALCGTIEVSGQRFVELFGCVRIPANEFLAFDDDEILALVRYQIRSQRNPTADPDKTKEMICLPQSPAH